MLIWQSYNIPFGGDNVNLTKNIMQFLLDLNWAREYQLEWEEADEKIVSFYEIFWKKNNVDVPLEVLSLLMCTRAQINQLLVEITAFSSHTSQL